MSVAPIGEKSAPSTPRNAGLINEQHWHQAVSMAAGFRLYQLPSLKRMEMSLLARAWDHSAQRMRDRMRERVIARALEKAKEARSHSKTLSVCLLQQLFALQEKGFKDV